ncbi:MAG TPA: ATP-binding protein [Euzebya sp.]|nr:ATP-binding protein [Euzebya sp.]
MDLLEREPLLDQLAGLLDGAMAGSGAVAFVAGEAGVGKSSLVRAFCDDLRGVRRLWGGCDPLFTSPPLGALQDMASRDRELQALFAEPVDRHEVFTRILAGLDHPTMMGIEDVHWADDATMDLLRFLGRRAPARLCRPDVVRRRTGRRRPARRPPAPGGGV